MQRGHVTNDDQVRWGDVVFFDQTWKCVQIADQYPLIRRRTLGNQGRRRGSAQAMLDELFTDDLHAVQTHVNDNGLLRLREHVPVEIDGIVFEMSRNEYARLGVIPMRQGNTSKVGEVNPRLGHQGGRLRFLTTRNVAIPGATSG